IDQHQQPRYLAVSAAAVLTSLPFARRIHQNLPSLSINSKVATAVAIAATAGGGLLIALLGRRLLNDCRRRRRLRAALNAKRAERRRAKAEFGAYLASQTMSDAEEAEIAALTARQLVAALRDGRLGQDRVLLAYQRRAYRADQSLNCVAEFLHPDLSEVNLAGPLKGLPVSVKENFVMAGRDACVGCSVFVGQPAEADCLPVRQIKALGGVPFVRTVVPQTMLSVLSSNPIDGTVLNPANRSRCPGGSSSGEGALIAAGGSPLGLGTDIGGSVRTPAAWCGVASLKVTGGRLSRLGMRGTGPQRLVEPAWGPMAPDVDSLALLLECLLEPPMPLPAELTDPTVPPMALELEAAMAVEAKMTIGYMVSNGQLRAAPCMERAVLLA
uniref:Amidase domain-containing protein n=1 Tax=Macrostomum lignano TaxID=282301 RepID=A0A1I8HSA5_9PLAT